MQKEKNGFPAHQGGSGGGVRSYIEKAANCPGGTTDPPVRSFGKGGIKEKNLCRAGSARPKERPSGKALRPYRGKCTSRAKEVKQPLTKRGKMSILAEVSGFTRGACCHRGNNTDHEGGAQSLRSSSGGGRGDQGSRKMKYPTSTSRDDDSNSRGKAKNVAGKREAIKRLAML